MCAYDTCVATNGIRANMTVISAFELLFVIGCSVDHGSRRQLTDSGLSQPTPACLHVCRNLRLRDVMFFFIILFIYWPLLWLIWCVDAISFWVYIYNICRGFSFVTCTFRTYSNSSTSNVATFRRRRHLGANTNNLRATSTQTLHARHTSNNTPLNRLYCPPLKSHHMLLANMSYIAAHVTTIMVAHSSY